jgi:outer membrane protein TolC
VRVTVAFLNSLIAEGLTNHPGLQGAITRAKASQLNVGSVRRWEDPMIRIGGVVADSRGPMLEQEGDLIYGIEQKLPLFGRTKRTLTLAERESEVESAQAILQSQLLRKQIVQAALSVALSDHLAHLSAADLGVLESLVATARSRYESRTGSQVDWLRLRNEWAERNDQLITEEKARGQTRASLDRLLGRIATNSWPEFLLPELAGPVVYSESLVDFAMRYEPRIAVLKSSIQQSQAAAALTQRQRLPEVTLELEARQYSRDGGVREGALIAGFTVPWFNARRYRHDFERDQAKVVAARQELQDYELAVREELVRLTVQLDAVRRQALLLQDEIIPRAAQAYAAARAAWSANAGLFSDVVETRRASLESQVKQGRALAEQYQLLADLVLCCGLGDLEALSMIGVFTDPPNPPTSLPSTPLP